MTEYFNSYGNILAIVACIVLVTLFILQNRKNKELDKEIKKLEDEVSVKRKEIEEMRKVVGGGR